MNPHTIILKFEQVVEQFEGPVKRIVGFVSAKNLLGLLDSADLEANPRSAKVGSVTDDIIESIQNSPTLFPFKTKGILVGSSHYRPLERRRYELTFVDSNVEGILDGGHNMLAIGSYILGHVISEPELRKIKNWDNLEEAWTNNRDKIDNIKKNLNFLVPVEIIVPSDLANDQVREEFNNSLLDICAARNNNVQLNLEAKANKKGFYDEIRNSLPSEIAEKIEWKTNDGGEIKVRDLIALVWIPLSKVKLPIDIFVSPQNIYRNKGECAKLFDKLMSDKEVTVSSEGGYEHKLHNPIILSAIKILGDLPRLYDKIYKDFPEAYNEGGNRFGRNPIVRIYDEKMAKEDPDKYMRSQPLSKYTKAPLRYRYPDGLIMPLVYGLSALMEISKNGTLQWTVDPDKFLDKWLKHIAAAYKLVLDMSDFDPQRLGKNETSYKIAVNEFENALLKEQMQNKAA